MSLSQRFPFEFAPSYRYAGWPFGVRPGTTHVDVSPSELRISFGPWRLLTPRTNVAQLHETGGYSFLKTAGPAHLSLADRGITFATNPDRGLCIGFHQPVRAIEPTGRILHPAATVTVEDIDGLVAALGLTVS